MRIKLFGFITILAAGLLASTNPALAAESNALSKQRVNQLTSDVLVNKASQAFEEKSIEKAIRLFQASIRYNPHNSEAHYRLGVVYAYDHNFKAAIASFKHAIKLRSDFSKAYLNMGSAYGQLKNYKLALLCYHKALAFDKNDPVIYYNIGTLYAALGRQDLSQEYLAKAKELAPAKPE